MIRSRPAFKSGMQRRAREAFPKVLVSRPGAIVGSGPRGEGEGAPSVEPGGGIEAHRRRLPRGGTNPRERALAPPAPRGGIRDAFRARPPIARQFPRHVPAGFRPRRCSPSSWPVPARNRARFAFRSRVTCRAAPGARQRPSGRCVPRGSGGRKASRSNELRAFLLWYVRGCRSARRDQRLSRGAIARRPSPVMWNQQLWENCPIAAKIAILGANYERRFSCRNL